MKLKISLVFLILAGGFTYFTFKGGYFSKVEKGMASKKTFSSEEILAQVRSFDLRDYNGNVVKLDQVEIAASKKIVIHLWASWCGPCVGEVPELIEFSKNNQDVVIVVVSLDDYLDDIEKFMKSFPEFNSERFRKIWDRDKHFSKYLEADRLPMSVILSGQAEPQLFKTIVDWKRLKI